MLWVGYTYMFQPHIKTDFKLSNPTFDSLLTNIHWVEFDELGKISQEFFSPEIKSIPQKHLYHIKTPRLKLSEHKDTWEILSRYAIVAQNKETIDLKKRVFIKHFSSDHSKISIIQTDVLRYLPKQKKAETKDLVTISLGNNIIHSKGLEAYFDQNKQFKLGQSYGQYRPSNKKN